MQPQSSKSLGGRCHKEPVCRLQPQLRSRLLPIAKAAAAPVAPEQGKQAQEAQQTPRPKLSFGEHKLCWSVQLQYVRIMLPQPCSIC
jgi:hypothetical protein